jgi:hypothetical protein
MFFFEKTLLPVTGGDGAPRLDRSLGETEKSFLLLFFKKRSSSLLPLTGALHVRFG